MRFLLFGLILICSFSPVQAQQQAASCVSPSDMRALVDQKRAVDPTVAIAAAQLSVPGSDILRANLCKRNGGLIYLIVALRADGKVIHVTVGGASGRVESLD